MKSPAPRTLALLALLLAFGPALTTTHAADPDYRARKSQIGDTPGLIAFWSFEESPMGEWLSCYDPALMDQAFPLSLRRIGDPQSYTPSTWPYDDEGSRLLTDASGPFGHAVRFNKGYIYGAVERADFEDTALNIHGHDPFTLIAWIKFTGKRHMVAGIWDEGGWDRYGGRRQIALFGGLFGKKGTIAHISATGAASFPQSTAKGSQYARARAIDGQDFANDEWVAMAMAYDPEKQEVTAYLNGEQTPLANTDSVQGDVYRPEQKLPANPYHFPHPLYSPQAFVLKYNGYDLSSGVYEHRLRVDLPKRQLVYEQDAVADTAAAGPWRIRVDLHRQGKSLLSTPILAEVQPGQKLALPERVDVEETDALITSLEAKVDGEWQVVGKPITRAITEGAPFTFGRALGLGSEELNHGSQLYMDGVAVFNRVLSLEELRSLSFVR